MLQFFGRGFIGGGVDELVNTRGGRAGKSNSLVVSRRVVVGGLSVSAIAAATHAVAAEPTAFDSKPPTFTLRPAPVRDDRGRPVVPRRYFAEILLRDQYLCEQHTIEKPPVTPVWRSCTPEEDQNLTAAEHGTIKRVWKNVTWHRFAFNAGPFANTETGIVFKPSEIEKFSTFEIDKSRFLDSETATFKLSFELLDKASVAYMQATVTFGNDSFKSDAVPAFDFLDDKRNIPLEFAIRTEKKLDAILARLFEKRISVDQGGGILKLFNDGHWEIQTDLKPSSRNRLVALEGAVTFRNLEIRRIPDSEGPGTALQEEITGKDTDKRRTKTASDPTTKAAQQNGQTQADAQGVKPASGQKRITTALIGIADGVEWDDKDPPTLNKFAPQLTFCHDPYVRLQLAFRHWGDPANSVSLLKTAGTATLIHAKSKQAPPSRFELREALLTRRIPSPEEQAGSGVVDEIRGLISDKTFTLDTAYGPVGIEGDPPEKPKAESGQPSKFPADFADIDLPELGRTEFYARLSADRLVNFEARALLRNFNIALERPALADSQNTKPAIANSNEVWSRLDFNATETLFSISGIEKRPVILRKRRAIENDRQLSKQERKDALQRAADGSFARAWIPLGEPPLTLSETPTNAVENRQFTTITAPIRIALDGATLSARRAGDQFALSFGFQGLFLEVGKRAKADNTTPYARIVPPQIRHAAGPTSTIAPGQSDVRRSDDRPRLLVHFPPQHVAEQAYYRQINDGIALPPAPEWIASPPTYFAKLTALAQNGCLQNEEKRRTLQDEQLPLETGEIKPFSSFLKLIQKFSSGTLWDDALWIDSYIALVPDWDALTTAQRIYIGTHPLALDPDAHRFFLALLRADDKVRRSRNEAGTAEEKIWTLPPLDAPASLRAVFEQTLNRELPSDASIWPSEPREQLRAELAQRDAAFARASKMYAELKPKALGVLFDDPEKKKEGHLPAEYPGPRILAARLEKAERARNDVRKFLITLYEHYYAPEKFEAVTPARLSGPSRLVFALTFDAAHEAIPFTLDGLTDWGRHDLVVTRRAEMLEIAPGGRQPFDTLRAPETDIGRILRYQGIQPDRTIAGRFDDIAGTLQEPAKNVTSIELPFRLMLSPSQFGRFRTPHPIDNTVLWPTGETWSVTPSLWSANLDLEGRAPLLRAIWSPDFKPGTVTARAPPPVRDNSAPWVLPSQEDEPAKFRTGLDAFDRHEIVGLSSIYGMPAMGRRSAALRLMDSSQVEPPENYKLPGIKTYKNEGLGKNTDQSAIYMPEPLGVRALRLSARGGTLNLDTTFRPPSPELDKLGRPLSIGFSVERWRQITVIGRDIETEVVYKGYLFPLGVRASLVKLTERLFFRNPQNCQISAFLIQRKFIRIGDPDKTYPAAGQADAGRRFPVSRLKMLTLQTPDIVDPLDDRVREPTKLPRLLRNAAGLEKQFWFSELPGGRIDFAEGAKGAPGDRVPEYSRSEMKPGLVFWPRTRPGASESISFEFTIEGNPSSVRMPLLFVDNIAANDPDVLSALSDYYNGAYETPRKFRTVWHDGARRRYAEEQREGQCTLETLSWTIGAEGRAGSTIDVLDPVELLDPKPPPNSDTPFNMRFEKDPILEGADQPPFYPFIARAKVKAGPAERFIGRSLPAVDIFFPKFYREKGFPKDDRNKDQVVPEGYAELIRQLSLDMGSAGDRSGGLAQPAMNVQWLSRKVGPVGAPSKPAPVSAPTGDAGGAPPAFDLKKFFSSDAKLLGLVTFSDLLNLTGNDQLPRMSEQIDSAIEETLSLLRREVLPVLTTAVRVFRTSWDKAAAEILKTTTSNIDATKLDLKLLYPELDASLTDLQKALDVAATGNALEAIVAFSTIRHSGHRLLNALRVIARDPVGPIKTEVRQRVRTLLGGVLELRDKLEATLQQPLQNVAKLLLDRLKAEAETQAQILLASLIRLPLFVELTTPVERAALEKAKVLAALTMLQAMAENKLASFPVFVSRKADEAIEDVKQEVLQATAKVLLVTLERYHTQIKDIEKLKDNATAIKTIAERLKQSSSAELRRNVEQTLTAIAGRSLESLLSDDGPLRKVVEAVRVFQDSKDDPVQRALTALKMLGDAMAEDLSIALVAVSRTWLQYCNSLIGEIRRALVAIAPPTDALVDLRTAITPASGQVPDARLVDLLAELRLAIQALELATTKVNGLPDACSDAAVARDVIRILAEPLAALRRVTALARDISRDLLTNQAVAIAFRVRFANAWLAAAKRAAKDANTAVTATAANTLDALATKLKAEAAGLPAPVREELEAIAKNIAAKDIASARGIIEQWQKEIENFPDVLQDEAALDLFQKQFEQRVRLVETEIRSKVAAPFERLVRLADRAEEQFCNALIKVIVQPAIKPLLTPLELVYEQIITAREELDTRIGNPSESGFLRFIAILFGQQQDKPFKDILAGETVPDLRRPPLDGIKSEQAWLQEASAKLTLVNFNRLKTLLGLWAAGNSAPLDLATRIFETLQRTVRGDIAQFVNFDRLRDDVESAVRQMVPARITRSYDFGVPLFEALPSGTSNPLLVFGNRVHPKGRPKELVLEATGVIDLFNPSQSSVRAAGYLPDMTLALFGGFDIVKLQFAPSHFTAVPGEGVNFNIKIDNVILGELVAFIKKLESYLGSPKNGSGFYIRPMSGRGGIGIVAGYGIALNPLSIGNMYISNLSLQVATELPFDKGDARFLIGIGRAEAPFMISAAPYAGCGYFGLIANSKRIVGFEASFEYGGGGGFSFGPLNGAGRITVGVFIRTGDGATELYGIFFAGGEATIAGFSLGSSSLYVRLTQKNGDLSGVAIFTYSFRVGLASIKFSVRVAREEKGSGSGTEAASLESDTRFAGLSQHGDAYAMDGKVLDLSPTEYSSSNASTTVHAKVRSAAVGKTRDYRKYKEYFSKSSNEWTFV